MIKRKSINGIGNTWSWLDKCSSKIIHIDDTYKGYVSLIKVEKVNQRITVDYDDSDLCLFDDGYKCLIFLPDDEKWCLSAVYNTLGEIVEWYFDMTKINSIDEQGNPFFDDLFLDVVVWPNFKITILDEDELIDALESNEITLDEYEMAHNTCNKVISEIIPNKDFLVTFCNKYLELLEH